MQTSRPAAVILAALAFVIGTGMFYNLATPDAVAAFESPLFFVYVALFIAAGLFQIPIPMWIVGSGFGITSETYWLIAKLIAWLTVLLGAMVLLIGIALFLMAPANR